MDLKNSPSPERSRPSERDPRDEETKYGFRWGPVDVMRAFADGRYRTIIVRTPKAELQVHVTPTGFIRTFQTVRHT
jgi:hypothetical protein